MTKEELKERLKQYALSVARLVLKLPYNIVNRNFSDECNRSASSSAANYRTALRAKSNADFINKLKIVEEELDKSLFLLEMIAEMNALFAEEIKPLSKEGNELLAIIVASLNTLRRNSLNKP